MAVEFTRVKLAKKRKELGLVRPGSYTSSAAWGQFINLSGALIFWFGKQRYSLIKESAYVNRF